MSFSDFKSIAEVQKLYAIRYEEEVFIAAIELPPPQSFLDDFAFNRKNIDIFSSEAARSETVISPLLREVYKHHYSCCSFWIQKSITFDAVLSGTPDYIFSKKSNLGKTVLETPIVMIVEAKKNDFEQGWGQCMAEMVAAQKINGSTPRPVYGIVTDANLWQFGQLRADVFTKDPENFTIDNLPRLFGALDVLTRRATQENEGCC